jgi:hypothetical protein
VLVTQQPGSIPDEILSQGDNWFIFHLLSAGDLGHVKNANSHFSNDILSSLLNEPIIGQGIFWSSAKKDRAYPIAMRVLSFEDLYSQRDRSWSAAPPVTFANNLRADAETVRQQAIVLGAIETGEPADPTEAEPHEEKDEPKIDNDALYRALAKGAISHDQKIMGDLDADGTPWGALNACIQKKLPSTVANPRDVAFHLVARTLNDLFGTNGWHSFASERTGSRWVKKGPKS